MVKFPKFQVFEGRDNQYYFHLSAINGEILLASEGYKSKQGAISGIASVKKNAVETQFEQKTAVNGQFYFVLKAQNGQIIGQSETYHSSVSAENGIDSVIRIAKDAPAEDTTIGAVSYPNPKFEVFEGNDGQFYFRLNARNGENILGSEGYKTKYGAKKGVISVRANADDDENFEAKESENGQYYFVLKAENGEIIGVSELYVSKENRDSGILSVMRVAEDAPLEDTTLHALLEIDIFESDDDESDDSTADESEYKNPKFQIFKGKDDEYYFHLTARNGQIILVSEGYTAKSGAKNGIDSVKKNVEETQFEKLESMDGQIYFVQKAKNGQVIGTSETYESEAGADNGIDSVIKNAPDAPIEDLTLVHA